MILIIDINDQEVSNQEILDKTALTDVLITYINTKLRPDILENILKLEIQRILVRKIRYEKICIYWFVGLFGFLYQKYNKKIIDFWS